MRNPALWALALAPTTKHDAALFVATHPHPRATYHAPLYPAHGTGPAGVLPRPARSNICRTAHAKAGCGPRVVYTPAGARRGGPADRRLRFAVGGGGAGEWLISARSPWWRGQAARKRCRWPAVDGRVCGAALLRQPHCHRSRPMGQCHACDDGHHIEIHLPTVGVPRRWWIVRPVPDQDITRLTAAAQRYDGGGTSPST
jgi:hypothetical protein